MTRKLGIITVEVQAKTGYLVSDDDGSATAYVTDDDAPAKPTGLHANGHVTDLGVAIRWDSTPRVGSRLRIHSLRYAVCNMNTIDGCNPSYDEDWTVRPGILVSGRALNQTWLSGLTQKVLYKVEVKTLIGGEDTGWSDFTLVYPTSSPPSSTGEVVANIPLYEHEPNGLFDYKLCTPGQVPTDKRRPYPAPSGINELKLRLAINQVTSSTKWLTPSGNIIKSRIGTTNVCENRIGDPIPNTIIFYDTQAYEDHCHERADSEESSAGCVVVNLHTGKKYIALHLRVPWTSTAETEDCTRFHATIQHEALHVFGLNHAEGGLREALSNSWQFRWKDICAPTKYDVVAVMAVYQSR